MNEKKVKGPLDPKVFQFDSVMSRVKPAKPQFVSIFLSVELAAELRELEADIEKAEKAIADAEGYAKDHKVERSLGDPDPVADATAKVNELTLRYNELAAEFEQSELKFEMQPTRRMNRTAARAAMVADGVDVEESDPEVAACYLLAEVASLPDGSHWTGSEWLQLLDSDLGESVLAPILQAFFKSEQEAQAITAPFSQKLSPPHDTGK